MDRPLLSETATTVTLQCIKHSFEVNRILTTKNYPVQLLSVKTSLRGTKRKFDSPQLFKSTYVCERDRRGTLFFGTLLDGFFRFLLVRYSVNQEFRSM